MHRQIKQTKWDKVVISVSGGKDSSALMQWAVDNFPKEKLICVHAQIDIDWHETLPIVKEQCEHFGLPLEVVIAVDKDGKEKGFLDQLTSPRIDRKTGDKKEYQFPSMSARWCTSILKTGPIDKYCRKLNGNVLVLIGERREESSQRAKLEAIRVDVKNTSKTKGRFITKYSPILDMSEKEVWGVIKENNIPIHPCYALGVSRASCAICIFSSDKEIEIAAKHAPDIVAKYIEAEESIEHTFRYKAATKTKPAQKISVKDILKKQKISWAV